MKQQIEDLFNRNSERILASASAAFGIVPSTLKRLGSFENFVFECELDGQPRILRLTDSEHRTPEAIHGELEWIAHLADNGVSVSRAVQSKSGGLVETIPLDLGNRNEGICFSAAMFEKAPGKHAGPEDWNERLFEQWGEMTARMHRLAKSFQPSRPEYKRRHWRDDEDLDIAAILPAGHELVIARFEELIARLLSLPTDPDSFGLIHVDFHQGNFFVHEGRITLFDFDDCHYDWFANDIAIPLFYASRSPMSGADTPAFARKFLGSFLLGYRKVRDLPEFWLNTLHDFMKLREMLLYSIVLVEEAATGSEWSRRYLHGRKERIEQSQPVIDIDFSEFVW